MSNTDHAPGPTNTGEIELLKVTLSENNMTFCISQLGADKIPWAALLPAVTVAVAEHIGREGAVEALARSMEALGSVPERSQLLN